MALVPNVNVASKRPRYNNWYFKLESESSAGTSQDDTESVYSIQNRETGRLLQRGACLADFHVNYLQT